MENCQGTKTLDGSFLKHNQSLGFSWEEGWSKQFTIPVLKQRKNNASSPGRRLELMLSGSSCLHRAFSRVICASPGSLLSSLDTQGQNHHPAPLADGDTDFLPDRTSSLLHLAGPWPDLAKNPAEPGVKRPPALGISQAPLPPPLASDQAPSVISTHSLTCPGCTGSGAPSPTCNGLE